MSAENDRLLFEIFGIDVNKPESIYCDVRLPFGKYRGKCLDEVPRGYLVWALENLRDLRPWLRRAIEGFLEDSR
jgi:hypothetical protein